MRAEISETAEPSAWDAQAAALGGGFFHSHAYGAYDACYPGTVPLYIRVLDGTGALAAVAVGAMASPSRWPLSKLARTATLGALPATRDPSAAAKAQALDAIEKALAAMGVHHLECKAYDSEAGVEALSTSGYALRERCEFYLDLSAGAEAAWNGFKSERRTAIRKAEKQGLVTKLESSPEAVQTLFQVQATALSRKGVAVDASEGLAKATLDLLRKGAGQLWITTLNGEAQNAALIGLCRDRAYYLASGSTPQGFKLAGPAHLVWTAVQALGEKGCTVFNLAGAPPAGPDPTKVDGLHRFKKDFGSRIVSQPAGTKSLGGVGAVIARVKAKIRP